MVNKYKQLQSSNKKRRTNAKHVTIREQKSLRSYMGHTKADKITLVIFFNEHLIKLLESYKITNIC